mgnify:CR=1 FL=1
MNEKDDLSLQLKTTISNGNLVSDKILNKIVSDKILSKSCNSGFILDGYPRTIDQMKYLNNFNNQNNININFIINISVDIQTIEERIISRSKLENRDDDSIDTIRTRIKNYIQETKPVSEFYSQNFHSIYYELEGTDKVDEIQKKLIKIVKNANFS